MMVKIDLLYNTVLPFLTEKILVQGMSSKFSDTLINSESEISTIESKSR